MTPVLEERLFERLESWDSSMVVAWTSAQGTRTLPSVAPNLTTTGRNRGEREGPTVAPSGPREARQQDDPGQVPEGGDAALGLAGAKGRTIAACSKCARGAGMLEGVVVKDGARPRADDSEVHERATVPAGGGGWQRRGSASGGTWQVNRLWISSRELQ